MTQISSSLPSLVGAAPLSGSTEDAVRAGDLSDDLATFQKILEKMAKRVDQPDEDTALIGIPIPGPTFNVVPARSRIIETKETVEAVFSDPSEKTTDAISGSLNQAEDENIIPDATSQPISTVNTVLPAPLPDRNTETIQEVAPASGRIAVGEARFQAEQGEATEERIVPDRLVQGAAIEKAKDGIAPARSERFDPVNTSARPASDSQADAPLNQQIVTVNPRISAQSVDPSLPTHVGKGQSPLPPGSGGQSVSDAVQPLPKKASGVDEGTLRLLWSGLDSDLKLVVSSTFSGATADQILRLQPVSGHQISTAPLTASADPEQQPALSGPTEQSLTPKLGSKDILPLQQPPKPEGHGLLPQPNEAGQLEAEVAFDIEQFAIGATSGPSLQASAAHPLRAEAGQGPGSNLPSINTQIVQTVTATGTGITELHLAPEELGQVQIDMRNDGDRLILTILAERPETLDLLRRHVDQLADELRAAGQTALNLNFGAWSDRREGKAVPDSGQAMRSQDPPLPTTAQNPPKDQPIGTGLYLRV